MEGNLTRARSSIRLGQTPSPSPTSPGILLPTRNLQPAGALYRSISQTDRRGSLLRPRPVYTTSQETTGHSRGHSETNLPSAASLKSPSLQPSRSMSALASSDSSRYDSRENVSPYSAPEIKSIQERRQSSRAEDEYRVQDRFVPVDDAEIRIRVITPIDKELSEKTFPLMFWTHGGGMHSYCVHLHLTHAAVVDSITRLLPWRHRSGRYNAPTHSCGSSHRYCKCGV